MKEILNFLSKSWYKRKLDFRSIVNSLKAKWLSKFQVDLPSKRKSSASTKSITKNKSGKLTAKMSCPSRMCSLDKSTALRATSTGLTNITGCSIQAPRNSTSISSYLQLSFSLLRTLSLWKWLTSPHGKCHQATAASLSTATWLLTMTRSKARIKGAHTQRDLSSSRG